MNMKQAKLETLQKCKARPTPLIREAFSDVRPPIHKFNPIALRLWISHDRVARPYAPFSSDAVFLKVVAIDEPRIVMFQARVQLIHMLTYGL